MVEAAADEEVADVAVPKKKGGKAKATKRKAAAPKGKTQPYTLLRHAGCHLLRLTSPRPWSSVPTLTPHH